MTVYWALPVVLLAAACAGPRETPLEPLHDLADNGGAAAAGHGKPMVHPRGLRFDIEASLVEETRRGPERAFHVTLHAHNTSGREVQLPYDTWRLYDDEGRPYRSEGALIWNVRTEEYDPAPPAIPSGATAILVTRFPIGSRIRVNHLVHVGLRWRYVHGGRTHRVVTRFRVR